MSSINSTKAAMIAVLLLAGCTTVPKAQFCQIAKAQRPSEAEIAVMTDARVKEVLELNEKGRRLCGWAP